MYPELFEKTGLERESCNGQKVHGVSVSLVRVGILKGLCRYIPCLGSEGLITIVTSLMHNVLDVIL